MDSRDIATLQHPDSDGAEAPLKVLLVDDDAFNRQYMAILLQAGGFSVLHAADGREAVAAFREHRPDLVFMDIVMPGMDGYEATQIIKAESTEGHVPVIFLTALTDTESLSKCLSCGGDDFLTKPYNDIILRAKLNAHARIRRLTVALNERNRQLHQFRHRTEREHRVAERVFSNTLAAGQVAHGAVSFRVSPLAIFNGDVFQCSLAPDGSLIVLLGDFTGHGLTAAIGALPVSEIFSTLVRNGRTLGQIAFELNHRLREILPEDMFFAAVLLSMSADGRAATVWSGGLPDLLLFDTQQRLRGRVSSQHMPLGILDDDEFDAQLQTIPLCHGDRLYLYTDGVIEARRDDQTIFGDDNLIDALSSVSRTDSAVDAVVAALTRFVGDSSQSDDVSIIEVRSEPTGSTAAEGEACTSSGAMPWQLSIPLRGESLRRINPVPQLASLLRGTPIPEEHRDLICTLLAEMYSNAVEHGVLGMDSRPKEDESSYVEYYEARKRDLADVRDGYVNIALEYTPQLFGGELLLRVQDSGKGFPIDPSEQHSPADNEEFHGMDLLRSLCEELHYDRSSNTLEAVYRWSTPGASQSSESFVI